MSLKNQIKEIKEQKSECVRIQRYEAAAALRDKERQLLEKLFEEVDTRKEYDSYIEEKEKEYIDLCAKYTNHKTYDLFKYAISNLLICGDLKIRLENKLNHKVYQDMMDKDISFFRENIENTMVLNKWILENIISFETWFVKYKYEEI